MPLPSTKYTAPAYAELESQARAWAVARGLIHLNGEPKMATVMGQFGKTLEEISEAQLELRKLEKSKALRLRLIAMSSRVYSECDTELLSDADRMLDRRLDRLALELGDVLVTLALLAAMHGLTLHACLVQAPRTPLTKPQIWQFVDAHAELLGDRLSMDVGPMLGAVARCVEDQARITLELSGPQCLALALAKIEGRQGEVVDGVFVKAVTVGA
jgi:hypothetical protein